MAAMSLALIIARRHFWDALNETEQTNLYRWLSSIEKRELPGNNWHFFRVMVCLAFRELGLPVDEAAERASLDLIESCYRENGWYEDGENGHFDLYNPWAFHFYGLVYAKAAGGRDPERAERFVRRARLFARRFVRWFREDGSMAAFGRSLTYRFAALSFWSACAFAGVEALPWGVMKGLVLRGLRDWFAKPILDASGVLSVGYGYPNLVMADRYNSPGSPYWALKAYLVLALGEDHPFWQAPEAPLPRLPALAVDPAAGFLSARSPEDAQLFPGAFAPAHDMNYAAEKYCKFASSARFGFCVSHSPGDIEQMGCDSMLFVRPKACGPGPETGGPPAAGPAAFWHGRRGVTERHFEGERLCCLWEPLRGVKIHTTLEVAGAWHIRTHRIESAVPLETFEGGFALPRNQGFAEAPAIRNGAGSTAEALAAFPWGASRIAALEVDSRRRGELVIPSPNLNVLYPQAVVPALRGELPPGVSVLVTAVRAGDRSPVETESPPAPRGGDFM
jgi:hypothetical protein